MKSLIKEGLYISKSIWSQTEEKKVAKTQEDIKSTTDEPYYSDEEDKVAMTTGMRAKPAAIKKQKLNPNSLLIKYAEAIGEAKDVVTSPIYCSKCGSVFNKAIAGKLKVAWRCFFCNNKNPLVPEIATVNENQLITRYLIAGEEKLAEEKDISFLFLIDKSGSMGKTSLPGMGKKSPIMVLINTIKEKMKTLCAEHPESKVGIIFFNHIITIVGDACSAPILMDNKKEMLEEDKLKELGAKATASLFKTPIKASFDKIQTSLTDEAAGKTALGPSIVIGMEMLRGCNTGSKMIIVTDGMANIGVGNIKGKEYENGKPCYARWASTAREMGIEVSLWSISTRSLDPTIYNQMAQQTNGNILIVEPDQITKEVNLPKDQPEFGKNAEVKILIPPFFRFSGAEKGTIIDNTYKKNYGRIVEDTCEMLKIAVIPETPYDFIMKNGKVPFQMQIKYIGKDRKNYFLSYTKEFKLIAERKKEVDVAVLTRHTVSMINKGLVETNTDNLYNELEAIVSEFDSVADPEVKGLIENALNIKKQLKPDELKEDTEVKKPKEESADRKRNAAIMTMNIDRKKPTI